MKEVVAFSPGHITGLFQICDQPAEVLLKGSRGAGVSITRGVTTSVRVERATKTSFEIRINGQVTGSAPVSEHVVKKLLALAGGNYKIAAAHEVGVPIGSGFGSSGAGALSLALALNEALSLGLSREEAAQVAHVAEVECKTGLGTVIAETYGGLEIRVKPGAPGIGEIRQIPISDDYLVACLNFGPISTKRVLSDGDIRERINRYGGRLVDELIRRPKPQSFMALSRDFAEHIGLISSRMREVLTEADEIGLPCSMAMLGESIFSLAKQDEVQKLLRIFRRHASSEGDVIVAEIDFDGARTA